MVEYAYEKTNTLKETVLVVNNLINSLAKQTERSDEFKSSNKRVRPLAMHGRWKRLWKSSTAFLFLSRFSHLVRNHQHHNDSFRCGLERAGDDRREDKIPIEGPKVERCISHACTDRFLVGILAQPIFIAGIISILLQKINGQSCVTQILSFAIANSLFTSSLLHLVLASGERYVAIKHPFQYTFIVTEARLLVASLLAWLLSVAVHILLAADIIVFFSINSTVIGLSIAIIVFCHCSVYLETRRHERQIAVQQVTPEARKQFEKDRKAFKVTSIVIGVLILCCTPLIFCRSVLFQLYTPSLNTFQTIIFLATTVVFFNSLLNPVIYCIRIRQFRVAFIESTFRNVNFARAEEIERQWFGEPNAANRREAGQDQGRRDQENVERAIYVHQNNTGAG